MNTTRLHTLTTALKAAESEITSIDRELDVTSDKEMHTGEVITVWESDLSNYNIETLSNTLNKLLSSENYMVDRGLFDPKETWFKLSEGSDKTNAPTIKLSIESYKLYSPQENEHIRKVLLDRRNQLATMCAEYKEEFKEIVNSSL